MVKVTDANASDSKSAYDLLESMFRWIVERTFSWFGWYRRLNIDYERKTRNSENMIYVAMICLMLKRIQVSPTATNAFH